MYPASPPSETAVSQFHRSRGARPFACAYSRDESKTSVFRSVGKGMNKTGLGQFADTKYPVVLAALGGLCASVIGVLVPPTMFWSELEIASIAEPGKDLPNIWPQVGQTRGIDENESWAADHSYRR